MIPWMIVVTCIAAANVCEKHGWPDVGANNFATRAECEMALIEIATRWKPKNGAYAFACRRWPR